MTDMDWIKRYPAMNVFIMIYFSQISNKKLFNTENAPTEKNVLERKKKISVSLLTDLFSQNKI